MSNASITSNEEKKLPTQVSRQMPEKPSSPAMDKPTCKGPKCLGGRASPIDNNASLPLIGEYMRSYIGILPILKSF